MRGWVRLAALVGLVGCAGGGPGDPTIDLASFDPAPETYEDVDLEHLRWVLEDEEQDAYLEGNADERRELMRRKWAELDPTPTTPENERKDEHYRRLAFTLAHFAREKPPGWDERGELLLRYGVPDVLEDMPADVLEGIGLVPPRQVWIYHWLKQAHRLDDHRFQGDYQDASRDRTTQRVDVLRIGGRLEEHLDNPGEARRDEDVDTRTPAELSVDADAPPRMWSGKFQPVDAEKAHRKSVLDHLVRRGHVALSEKRQAFLHDYGGEQLPFAYDVVNFRAPQSDRTRVEVHLATFSEDLGYSESPGGREAVLRAEAVVKSEDYRELDRIERRFLHYRDPLDRDATRLALDEFALDLEPGEYRLSLAVRDSVTSKIGIFDTDFTVREFREGELALSDIQLALDVRSAPGPDAPFTRGGYQIVPFPLAAFPRGRDIHLYFEVYGLEPAPAGNRLYTVELLLRPKSVKTRSWFGSSRGRLVPGVATAFDGVSNREVVQEYIALDPSTFDEDVYDVEITVLDRVSDRRATRAIRFAIQEE